MRLPFLRPKTAATKERARPAPAGDEASEVSAARTRARRRLVGAVVLLLAGVIGFPLLFETQPRPLPLNTPIEVAAQGSAQEPATPSPARRPGPAPLAPKPVTNSTSSTPPPVQSSPALAEPVPEPAPAPPPRAAAVTIPPPSPASTPAVAQAPTRQASAATAPTRAPAPGPVTVAQAPAPASAAVPAVAGSAAGRFVVQVGAYTDAAAVRDARTKVEKLGLKSYTQVVDSDTGKRTRVRVGPFASRDEADAVAAKAKRAGLPVAVLTL